MRGLSEDTTEQLRGAEEVVTKRAKRIWSGFNDFALQDNVLEVAVGLILAAAFTAVVTSFVSEILLPPLSLLPFVRKNLDEKFVILRQGPKYTQGVLYNTTQQAVDDGAVVMAYGAFVNKFLSFLGMAFALYGIASMYECFSSEKIIKRTTRCKYCRKWISEKLAGWEGGQTLYHLMTFLIAGAPPQVKKPSADLAEEIWRIHINELLGLA